MLKSFYNTLFKRNINKLIKETVDINVRPYNLPLVDITHITIGDLHSNAIKLLYFLVRHGIIEISAIHYDRVVAIYYATNNLHHEELKNPARVNFYKNLIVEFNTLIDEIKILTNKIRITFIGDELADRGGNDYFILKIIQKLHHDHIDMTILLSNHGVEFIEAYECYAAREKKLFGTCIPSKGSAQSLYKLAILIEYNVISFHEIHTIVENCYLPSLKLLDYSLNDNTQISLFSHAPIGLTEIELLAKKMSVTFNSSSHKELAATINRINNYFFTHYVTPHKINTLYPHGEIDVGYIEPTTPTSPTTPSNTQAESIPTTVDNVVTCIMWNREYDKLHRPSQVNGYRLRFVHGHCFSISPDADYVVNLNNILGGSLAHHKGEYTVLLTNEKQTQSLNLNYLAVNLNLFCLGLTGLYLAARQPRLNYTSFFMPKLAINHTETAAAIFDIKKS